MENISNPNINEKRGDIMVMLKNANDELNNEIEWLIQGESDPLNNSKGYTEGISCRTSKPRLVRSAILFPWSEAPEVEPGWGMQQKAENSGVNPMLFPQNRWLFHAAGQKRVSPTEIRWDTLSATSPEILSSAHKTRPFCASAADKCFWWSRVFHHHGRTQRYRSHRSCRAYRLKRWKTVYLQQNNYRVHRANQEKTGETDQAAHTKSHLGSLSQILCKPPK